ncbi:MAG: serine/threonine protein kinase [Halioglobus sp.]|jgi:serine/threonine protein kinase
MARVALHEANGIYYKEFFPRSPIEKLKALVKGSRATRARLHSEALLLAGFDAPKNISWGQLGNSREYLFTHAVPGFGITTWLRNELSERDPSSLKKRRQLLRELGIFVGRMHATGFIHGDLRSSNVMAAEHLDRFQFSLIDNERNVRKTPPSGKQLLKNIMQLNMLFPSDLTRSDRLRFFRAWHTQMRDLTKVEAEILGVEAYKWACRRLQAKGKMSI